MDQDIQKNWETLGTLLKRIGEGHEEHLQAAIKRYAEQNLVVLNDMLALSITHLKKLQDAASHSDLIMAEINVANEMSKQLSLSAQRLLNASLNNIAHYNAYDLATD